MTCPICNTKLVVQGDLSEDGNETCPNGHFYYSHSYGNHEIHYDADGNKFITLSLGQHYNETTEEMMLREKVEQAFVKYAKFLRQKHAAYVGVILDEEDK